jgi:hypothetical protein
MSTMEPDEGAQPEDQRSDAPRWDKTEAADPADAPRWDEAQQPEGTADAPRWDEVQEPVREDAPRWDELDTSGEGPDDPDASTDS